MTKCIASVASSHRNRGISFSDRFRVSLQISTCSKRTRVITSPDVASRSWICHICGLILKCPCALEIERNGRSCRGAYWLLSRYGFAPDVIIVCWQPLVIYVPRFLNFSISLFPTPPVSSYPGIYSSSLSLRSRRSPRIRHTSRRSSFLALYY